VNITILKDEKYTIQQIKEIMNAYATKKYDKDEYLSELRVLEKEELIRIQDTTVDELKDILMIDAQEQLNSNKDI